MTQQEKFVSAVLLRTGGSVSPNMRAFLDLMLAADDGVFGKTMQFFDECNSHNFGRAS